LINAQSKARNVLMWLLAFTLVAGTSTLFIHSTLASESTRIYLDPSDPTFPMGTTVGTKFNVTVWVENATTDIGGAQIKLEFNDTIIRVTRWWAPYWDANFFMPLPYKALPAPPNNVGYIHVGPGNGYVKIAVSKAGEPPEAPWGHNGTIAIFEFNITALPPDGGQLSCLLHINTATTYLLDPVADEISGVTKEDGTYTIIPEFQLVILLSVFIASTTAVVLLRKRVIRKLNYV